MKSILYLIASAFVVYIMGLSFFPNLTSSFLENIGLGNFNNQVVQVKNDVKDFFDNLDVVGKFKETKEKTLEIKQNIEGQVENTKQKIETIQTNVDNTTKAINETTNSINKTIDSLGELQKSITDVANFSGTSNGSGNSTLTGTNNN